MHFGKIKNNFSSWDQYTVKTNNHKRKIPTKIQQDIITDVLKFLPKELSIATVELNVISLATLTENKMIDGDVRLSILNSKSPLLIQYVDYILQIIVFEDLLSEFKEDELTSLFVHDLMYSVLTTSTNTRIKRMIIEIFELVSVVKSETIDMIKILVALHVFATPFRNPYLDGKGVTGIDDTIIEMMTDSEIRMYNHAVTKINKDRYSDIVTYVENNKQQEAKDLAATIVNDVLSNDMQVASMFANMVENNELDLYLKRLNPIFNLKIRPGKVLSHILNEAVTDKKTSDEDMWNLYELSSNLDKAQIKTISEIRYDIDKLSVLVSNIEDEDERLDVMYRCKLIQKAILKALRKAQKMDNKEAAKVSKYLQSLDKMVLEMKEKSRKLKITPKKYGVFIEYPAGYEID